MPPHHSGAAYQAITLARRLVTMGQSVWFLTARYAGEEPLTSLANLPVSQVCVPCRREARGYIPWAHFVARSFRALVAKRDAWDLLHIHGGSSPLIGGVLAAKLLNKSSVIKISMIGDDDLQSLANSRWGWMLRRVMKSADAFVAMSDAIASDLAAAGVRRDKIFRMPNGVDTERFQPRDSHDRRDRRRKLGVPEEGFVIASVGAVIERKGLHRLIPALATLVGRGVDGHLLIIGPTTYEPEYFTRLQQQIRISGLDQRIRFLGAQERPEDFLQVADVFAFVSVREGLPNALLEAMSCGLPSVVANLAGLDEVLVDHANGIVLPEDYSTEQLADAMQSLAEDHATRCTLGNAARRTVVRRFSIDRVARECLHIYGTVLGRHWGGEVILHSPKSG